MCFWEAGSRLRVPRCGNPIGVKIPLSTSIFVRPLIGAHLSRCGLARTNPWLSGGYVPGFPSLDFPVASDFVHVAGFGDPFRVPTPDVSDEINISEQAAWTPMHTAWAEPIGQPAVSGMRASVASTEQTCTFSKTKEHEEKYK